MKIIERSKTPGLELLSLRFDTPREWDAWRSAPENADWLVSWEGWVGDGSSYGADLHREIKDEPASDELLSVAVELLETLEHLARHDPHIRDQGYGSAILPSLFERAHSAIAKAKGEK